MMDVEKMKVEMEKLQFKMQISALKETNRLQAEYATLSPESREKMQSELLAHENKMAEEYSEAGSGDLDTDQLEIRILELQAKSQEEINAIQARYVSFTDSNLKEMQNGILAHNLVTQKRFRQYLAATGILDSEPIGLDGFNCPNCAAPLTFSGKCAYCNSVISVDLLEF